MLEKIYNSVDIKKRNKHFSTLNLEEVAVLQSSDNAEHITKEFDRIFLKLQRLISYSISKNNSEKSEIEEDTNNLLKKFLNYIKWKTLPKKISVEQSAFFIDICRFINAFEKDSYFTKVHNSVAKTSLRDFNKKSVPAEFFQISYWRERWIEWMPEGWSCSYWTVLLYNFFNKLKEAWLDLDIKLFRYKNLDDKIVGKPMMRHSWLIVKFQWEEYFVDHEWIQLQWNGDPLVRKLQPYIDVAKVNLKDEKMCNFFENFKFENMIENDQIKFFDDINDFISYTEKYPSYHRIAFYYPDINSERVDKIDIEFVKNWIWIAINGNWRIFYLDNNNLTKEDSPLNIVKKIKFEKDDTWVHPITKESKEFFKKYFALVANKINSDWLYNNFMTYWKWSNKLINLEWKNVVAMMVNKN